MNHRKRFDQHVELLRGSCRTCGGIIVLVDFRWRYCVKGLVVTKCVEVLTGKLNDVIDRAIEIADGELVVAGQEFTYQGELFFKHGDHNGPDDPEELWRLSVREARRGS